MRVQITHIPDRYIKCFDSEGHIIFERFMRELMNPVEKAHVHYAFDRCTKQLMLDRIVNEVNQILPSCLICSSDDFIIEMQTDVKTLYPNGVVDFRIHQPLLGILSSLTYVSFHTITCNANL